MSITSILFGVVGILGGFVIGAFVLKPKPYSESAYDRQIEELFTDAESQKKELMTRAKLKANEIRDRIEFDRKEMELEIETHNKMIEVKTQSVEKREAKVNEIKSEVDAEQKIVDDMRAKALAIEQELADQLIRITGVTREGARDSLMKKYEEEFVHDAELRLARAQEWAQERAVREAKSVLAESMCRYSSGACRESHMTKIKVPQDEIKGRIVGRGGRLITLFEELFAVDVIFNDEPGIIIISCFNIVAEETARVGMELLMRERVINEEVIKNIKKRADLEVEKTLRMHGARILKEIGLPNMPDEFAQLVGRLKFRTSYGQNVMRHSLEVGYFAKLIAARIGADERTAFLAGFFHDIGKAIDQEVGGSHDYLTKEILEKYNFSWEVTHAAWTHHDAIPQETVEALIIKAADALSAGRPGARAESADRYVERIIELQNTAFESPGVRKAFAINAGRELRVLVDHEKLYDQNLQPLADEIAKKVEAKGGYPGKIRIVTIRSTKSSSTARKGTGS